MNKGFNTQWTHTSYASGSINTLFNNVGVLSFTCELVSK